VRTRTLSWSLSKRFPSQQSIPPHHEISLATGTTAGRGRRILVLVAVAFLLVSIASAGCAGSSRRTATSPSTIATIVAGTFDAAAAQTGTPPIPSATFTPKPTPTLTPVPTIKPADAERIRMLSDATMATVGGSVPARGYRLYVFRAELGQPLVVELASPNNDLALSLGTAGGTRILRADANKQTWRGSAPQGEDYLLGIANPGPAEDFSLSLRLAGRLKIPEGEDFVKVNARTVGGIPMVYSILGIKGQTMEIDLVTGDDKTFLQVEGFVDGNIYLASADHKQSYKALVASTQDYIVQIVPTPGDVIRFSLTVQQR
jgi:hypothetical protein